MSEYPPRTEVDWKCVGEDEVRGLREGRRHQVHNCGRYCQSEYRDGCRFGYPRKSSFRQTYFDNDKNRFVYQCGEEDSQIVGYNMYLLHFGRVNMDLQYNHGSQAKRYMCKYMTKQAAVHEETIAQDRNHSMNERHVVSDAYVKNFHYRSISVTEAIMDLCSWSMSGVSHDVVYLATDLPEKRQNLLKRVRDISIMDEEDTDIFLSSKWIKYLERPDDIRGKLVKLSLCRYSIPCLCVYLSLPGLR